MSLSLNNLKSSKGTKRSKKRLGRGNASGKGTYSGRGLKGQRSRSGGKSGLSKRAMMTLVSSLPKYKGFKSRKDVAQVVNIGAISSAFQNNSRLTPKMFRAIGLVSEIKHGVKVLGKGKLDKKFTFVKGFVFSQSAIEKIKSVGGTVESSKKVDSKKKIELKKKVESNSSEGGSTSGGEK